MLGKMLNSGARGDGALLAATERAPRIGTPAQLHSPRSNRARAAPWDWHCLILRFCPMLGEWRRWRKRSREETMARLG